jgi:FKBP-type peptidyl-prolyl cis-trans isomerase FklB
MKLIKLSFLVAVISLASCQNKPGAVSQKKLETSIDSVSYAIGLDVAKNVKSSFDDFSNELFLQGFQNGSDSTDILIDQAQAQAVIQSYFQKKQQEEAEKRKAEGEKNKAEGEKFLESNATKEGVKVTESGLQYQVIKEGTGKKPSADSKVKVHYHGTLIDGTVFDSSVDRGQPTEFGVNQVIRGWTEGLQLMKEGAKYKFFIPQDLAYGANPRPGGAIKPYATLVFDVELLEIVK